jgi:ACS family hexuronate transporter-like MFS transporter
MHVAAPLPRENTRAARSPLPSRWLVAGTATLVMAVSYIDRQTLAAISPTVKKALSISFEQYGWLLSAFSLAYLVAAPLAGAVLDRTGARRGLVFSVIAWSIVAVSHALVPSFAVLVVLRILLGTTEAPSFPGAAQTMKRILPPTERSMGIGLLFTGSSIGAMVAGPLAIGILEASGGWRTAFVGTGLLGLLWIPIWLVVTRPSGVRDALASSDDPSESAQPPPVMTLMTHRAVTRAVMLVVFSAPSIMFGLNWSSHYLEGTFGLSQSALAGYIWLPPLGFDLGAVAFGALASRADRRRARAGESAPKSHTALLATAAVLSTTMAVTPLLARGPWAAMALVSICLAGGGGIFALLTGDMLKRVHPSHAAAAGGLTASAQSLAYIVANPLVGRAVDVTHSYALVLVVLGAVVAPATAVWAMWPVRDRDSSR